jgi:hypothetical protein
VRVAGVTVRMIEPGPGDACNSRVVRRRTSALGCLPRALSPCCAAPAAAARRWKPCITRATSDMEAAEPVTPSPAMRMLPREARVRPRVSSAIRDSMLMRERSSGVDQVGALESAIAARIADSIWSSSSSLVAIHDHLHVAAAR